MTSISAPALFAIQGLTHRYPGQEQDALHQVDLMIPRGSVFGLLGPNGAGKTTLLSILLGLQQPSAGTVHYDGLALQQHLSTVRAQTGFVPQDLAFYPMLSVQENLDFYVRAFGIARPWRARRIEQAVAAARLEHYLRIPAQRLSGGLKRRLNLAIGLLNNPRVLFLDEPTVGIDPQSRNFILETISRLNREQGMTLIYTSHYMEEVQQICDHIAIIDSGRILLQGELNALLEQARGQRLHFRLQQLPSAAQHGAILALGFAAQGERSYACEAVVDALPLLAQLQAYLSAQGLALGELDYGQSSLENLYMAQTHLAPRE